MDVVALPVCPGHPHSPLTLREGGFAQPQVSPVHGEMSARTKGAEAKPHLSHPLWIPAFAGMT